MISQRLVDHVHGPVLSWIGTRDARLRPSITWVMGTRASPAGDELTLFVPDIEIARTKHNLEQNGLIAVTYVEPISHDAYQFKGKLVAMRPTTEEERAVQEIHRDKVMAHVVKYTKFPPALILGFRLHPSTAIICRVEEVFLQTPGPGAGKRLDMSAEID